MSDVYTDYQQPITEMRKLTALNTPFRMQFKKLDGSNKTIERALLRKQSLSDKDKNSAYKLQYLDTIHDTLGSCFIPLLTALNGKKIVIQ